MTTLTAISQDVITPLSQPLDDVINGLLASKHKQTTRNTYRLNLNHFAHYLFTGLMVKGQKISIKELQTKVILNEFLSFTNKLGNAYLAQYQTAMVTAGYTPNSINVKIASVKALVKFANDYEFTAMNLDKVKSLTPEVYRDTKGTNTDNIAKIISGINQDTISGKRDYAIMRLLWDCALRRSEVSSLSIEDFNEGELTLKITGKGRFSKETIYLSSKTVEAIKQWLAVRFNPNGSQPLFISLDNVTRGHRLSTKSVYRITKKYSKDIKELSPHQVRHSAITAVLDASNGNVRLAQKLSRHKNLDVLTRYDDNRVALQKEAVNLLADMV